MTAMKLGCDHSRNVAMVTNFCLFDADNSFCYSDQCSINYVHSSTTHSTVISVIGYTRSIVDEFC